MDHKLLAVAGGSTLLYTVLSVFMAILPGIELSAVPPGADVHDLTLLQKQGRAVYVSEGCAYCHTQQVRPLAVDKVFGRPSAPGDFAFSTPELLGSERTGPDLTNIGGRQSSEIWQYMHLYNPRSVVPQSIMPSFPWLFKVVDQAPKGIQAVPIPKKYAPSHGVVIPSPKAQALIAYLLSLKQPMLPNSEPTVAAATKPTQSTAHTPASDQKVLGFDAANGLKLFAANCAACHGAQGAGVPGVFPPLAGNPVVNAADPTEHITVVLQGIHGKTIDGTAYAAQMPSFAAQLSDAEIADIIGHERTSWGNHAPTATAEDITKVRAKK